MKYLETQHERNAAKITTLIVMILVLLCFVVGQDYKEDPEEYGVAINFGDANIVNNTITPNEEEDVQDAEAIDPEEVEEEVLEEETEEQETEEEETEEEETEEAEAKEAAEQAEAAAAEEAVAAEKLLAQEAKEALKVKNEKETKEAKKAKEAKEKLEKEAKEKEEKVAAAKKAADAKAKADKEAKSKAAAKKAESDRKAKEKADGEAAAAAAAKKKKGNTVSFALIEQAPIYPGCENGDNNAKKKCMNSKIKSFIAENFDTSLTAKLGLMGLQKINIFFKISETGKVVNIRVKSPNPELTAEAKRVANLLPKMKPGMQQGRPVIVPFSLPVNIKGN